CMYRDLHEADVAQQTRLDGTSHREKVAIPTPILKYREQLAALPGSLDHAIRRHGRERHDLLAYHVTACGQRFQHEALMRVVRRSDDDELNAFVLEHRVQ